MRKLRVILQRLRAFRLKKKHFFLSNLKRRSRSSSSSSRDLNSRSKRAQSMASSSKNEKFGPQSSFLKKKQQSRGGPSGLDLLACNPCTGNTAGMVVENYKFQIQGPKRLPRPQSENWENEKSWNIVTQVGDEFVTKKVILKKKSKSKSKSEAALASNVQAAAAFCEDDPFEGSCSSSRYRLSTSSSIAEASCGENINLMYSWDKELSFASGDDRYLDEDRHSCEILDRLEASSKDVFVDPPCCKACTFSDAQLLGGSFSSFEHYIRSVQSAGDKHFPSPDSASIEDAQETVADFPSECSSDEAEIPKGVESERIAECEQATITAPCTRIEKKDSQVGRGCGGVAVEKVSVDPYKDYRDSMLEMSAANGFKQGSDFEELLQCYLSLNPPEFHNIIVEVFTDLFWQRLVI